MGDAQLCRNGGGCLCLRRRLINPGNIAGTAGTAASVVGSCLAVPPWRRVGVPGAGAGDGGGDAGMRGGSSVPRGCRGVGFPTPAARVPLQNPKEPRLPPETRRYGWVINVYDRRERKQITFISLVFFIGALI